VLEQLCVQRQGALKVVKVNAIDNYEAPAAHRVSGFPTFVIYRAGRVMGQLKGYPSRESFEKWITETVPV
jgi:thioredoxin-like negative regulator of GroEL